MPLPHILFIPTFELIRNPVKEKKIRGTFSVPLELLYICLCLKNQQLFLKNWYDLASFIDYDQRRGGLSLSTYARGESQSFIFVPRFKLHKEYVVGVEMALISEQAGYGIRRLQFLHEVIYANPARHTTTFLLLRLGRGSTQLGDYAIDNGPTLIGLAKGFEHSCDRSTTSQRSRRSNMRS